MLSLMILFLRYGDGSDDPVAEHNPGEEHFFVSGWWASLSTSRLQCIKPDSHSDEIIAGLSVTL